MKKTFIFMSLFLALFAILQICGESIRAEENNQAQESPVTEPLDKIKKKHGNDYNSGIYNSDKKDYVKNWINEDIDYQKKVIKLKSDYRDWAMDKISKGVNVDYKEYISLKSYSRTEKEILLDYHNKHFNNKLKEKSSSISDPANTRKVQIGPGRKKNKSADSRLNSHGIALINPKISYKTEENGNIIQIRSLEIFICAVVIAVYFIITYLFADKIKN